MAILHSSFSHQFTYLYLMILSTQTPFPSNAHKILLFPFTQGFSSHLLSMLQLGTILQEGGHHVTFLVPDDSRSKVQDEGFSALSYPSPSGVSEDLEMSEIKSFVFDKNPASQFNLLMIYEQRGMKFCESLLAQFNLHKSLREQEYDLVLFDKAELCSCFLVKILRIPAVVYYGVGYASLDPGHFPSFPSFIPGLYTTYTDDMTFFERFKNFGELLLGRLMFPFIADPHYSQLSTKYGISYDLDISAKSLQLIHSNFALDYARPINPNQINIGGIFSRPGKPLSSALEAFMNSAGRDGVIVVSFGTVISTMDNRGEKFARAFARLPHKVIWRYSTKTEAPRGLGANTLLQDWIPQNDLLANTSTKLFVTHCGMSSTYEAVNHAVPVLAIPICAEQFQNAHKLVTKAKMGLMLDFHTFTEDDLYRAIMELTSNQSFRAHALKTSKLLEAQPVSPRQQLLHYVDLVGRYKGVNHLLQPALWKLSFIQIYCLDIIALCLTVIVFGGILVFCMIRKCYKWMCCTLQEKQKIN